MAQQLAKDNTPEVLVSIKLDPSLTAVFEDASSFPERVQRQIAAKTVAFLDILGAPGTPSITLNALDVDTVSAGKFIGINVNGNTCPYPNELLLGVHSYVTGTMIDLEVRPKEILEWLKALSNDQAKAVEGGSERLSEFLSLACLEIISRQPEAILDLAHAAAYSDSLPTPTNTTQPLQDWPPDPVWLWPILRGVLKLRISIADKQVVADTVHQGLLKGRSQKDVSEDLIELLRPDVVEIQLPEDFLRQLTLNDINNEHDRFAVMRDGWFYESGIHHPRFRFVPNENLKPNSCAIKINHLTTLPRPVLNPNTWLNDDARTDLQLLNIDALATINPITGKPCSIIDSSHKSDIENARGVTWDQMEYLVLCLGGVLRERSDCLIDRRVVTKELTKLESSFPALVDAVRDKTSIEQITRVLRALMAEEVSIRNLATILESMLDYDYIIADPAEHIVLSDGMPAPSEPTQEWINDPANLTAFVRTGLKDYLSYKYAMGSKTLMVYLLDRTIEQMISGEQARPALEGTSPLDQNSRDRILAAVRAELEDLSPNTQFPAILTTIDVRQRLREIVAEEFPRLPVIAYQELSPSTNITTLARIKMST